MEFWILSSQSNLKQITPQQLDFPNHKTREQMLCCCFIWAAVLKSLRICFADGEVDEEIYIYILYLYICAYMKHSYVPACWASNMAKQQWQWESGKYCFTHEGSFQSITAWVPSFHRCNCLGKWGGISLYQIWTDHPSCWSLATHFSLV